jgi:hypothetical protein
MTEKPLLKGMEPKVLSEELEKEALRLMQLHGLQDSKRQTQKAPRKLKIQTTFELLPKLHNRKSGATLRGAGATFIPLCLESIPAKLREICVLGEAYTAVISSEKISPHGCFNVTIQDPNTMETIRFRGRAQDFILATPENVPVVSQVMTIVRTLSGEQRSKQLSALLKKHAMSK